MNMNHAANSMERATADGGVGEGDCIYALLLHSFDLGYPNSVEAGQRRS
jgi:hypothetical protein